MYPDRQLDFALELALEDALEDFDPTMEEPTLGEKIGGVMMSIGWWLLASAFIIRAAAIW